MQPTFWAMASFAAGTVLAIAGIYILIGTGWALIAASVPFLLFALVIFRGIARG